MNRGLGYRPDPVDTNDHDALKAIRTSTPPLSKPRSIFTRTLDQGGLGSCTCNAAAQAIRAAELCALVGAGMSIEDAQAAVEFMSRLFPYYFARAISHETQMDSGTFIRFVFQVLNTFGFCSESMWSYSDDAVKFAKMPSSAAVRAAYDQCLAASGDAVVHYARIASTGNARVNDVKRALADEHLVVFGVQVTEAFCSDMTANGGKPLAPPKPADKIAGGHAMVWGGYDGDAFDTLNSWGAGFGDGGWFKMSAEYIVAASDLWIVQRAPLITGVTP